MARWRLIEPHYLLTADPTKWEYQETDRTTGRQKRVAFEVPRYIHHEDPADFTIKDGPDGGYVTVSDGNNPDRRDIIFKGEPTPGMIPLDDDAIAVSAKYKDKWDVPTEPLIHEGFGWASQLTDQFIAQQNLIADKIAQASAVPVPGMEQLIAVMTQMVQQQQEMMMSVTAKQLGIKPVVNNLPPLEKVK